MCQRVCRQNLCHWIGYCREGTFFLSERLEEADGREVWSNYAVVMCLAVLLSNSWMVAWMVASANVIHITVGGDRCPPHLSPPPLYTRER